MPTVLWLQCVILLVLCLLMAPSAVAQFFPGKVWRDVQGDSIQAHGGGILFYGNVYYWFGEDRTPDLYSAVSCYSSTNLVDWKREGAALWRRDLLKVNGHRPFVERPKVIYNPATKKFVMWMHLDQAGYRFSRAGIAVSDTPTGSFIFVKAIRPIADTNDFSASDPAAQSVYGGTFRDMNLFVDDDGKAYVFYSSAGNWTMYVVRLNAEFTGPETPCVENKTWARILTRQMREGPAPFKWRGQYFLITSACTGWAPNAANYSSAGNILGPWRTFGNPCAGPGADKTFGSQSTFVLPIPGRRNDFIFMADKWNPDNLPDSRYVWLPFSMNANGTFAIPWHDDGRSNLVEKPQLP
ncbi:MAG TPA: glycoside hydrolase family 43 protein [Verrucomicrobiae bacterium]|nr:glycoside hydrolase family 43 protein [Verrucomicrobiae bacterium]